MLLPVDCRLSLTRETSLEIKVCKGIGRNVNEENRKLKKQKRGCQET